MVVSFMFPHGTVQIQESDVVYFHKNVFIISLSFETFLKLDRQKMESLVQENHL